MSDQNADLDRLTAKIARAAEGKDGFGKVILLDLAEDGAIRIDGSGETTRVDNARSAADVVVSLSATTLDALMRGEISPPMAVMRGKIKLQGDASLALKLAKFL